MVPRSFGTHGGSFHADEVTACSLLLLFGKIDRDKIVRSRGEAVLAGCEYVCDVGGIYDTAQKRFDHHQVGYQGSLSSAGMVWRYLLDEGVVDLTTYDYFNHALILGVDAHDNGKASLEDGVCTFSQIISAFVPAEYDAPEGKLTAAFFEALDFAVGHLGRLLRRLEYTLSCKEQVLEAMRPQGKCLFFEAPIPWMDLFFAAGGEEHPALFVVMPSGKQWKLRGIPPNGQDRMQVRRPLPQAWAGLMDEALKEASGIEGAVFCHKGRFISVWETKEDALKALSQVLG